MLIDPTDYYPFSEELTTQSMKSKRNLEKEHEE